ncbi:hypothetical protein K1719_017781 [Acacia pycnantha]|nr:hypothetical protein K1719_017781 [Acacia pycnantha]
MRDAMKELGSDSNKINHLVPVDLVIDHSVQVEVKRSENAVQANMELEFQRNKEGFAFLKWGSATDLVLTVTQMLRKHGVVGKFVEFFRDGMGELSLADRATIANMSLEYGATMGLPCRSCYSTIPQVTMIEAYLMENLDDVEPCILGPKRPHDRVLLKEMKADWNACLDNKVGFKVSDVVLQKSMILFCDLADRMIQEKDNEISRLLDDNNNLHQSQQSSPSVSYLASHIVLILLPYNLTYLF